MGAEHLRPRTEISIRDLHQNPSLRRKNRDQILGGRIDDEDGPPLYAMESEED